MDSACRHFWKSRLAGRLRLVRRLLPCMAIAAGVALAAPADAQQARQAAGSTYGPVRQADTLWELALRFSAGVDVSIHQAMIAILRANPEAFLEGNINALRTGVELRVPSAEEMTAISSGEATAEFTRHEDAWRNRGRTGSAAPPPGPAPGPEAASRPSSPPVQAPAAGGEEGEDVAEELRKARVTVLDLRERLDERDLAIEELLIELAAARQELRRARTGAPARPGGSAGQEGEAGGPDAGTRGSWLPVSPLILGSSLLVLLVLIVVVTLLRRQGESEDAHPEELSEEGEEGACDEGQGPESGDEVDTRGPYDPDDGRDDIHRGGEEVPDVERRTPDRSLSGVAASGAVAATAADHGFVLEDETGEPREDEGADLPIGMDLEGEEEWSSAPGDLSGLHVESMEDPGSSSGFGRHMEVGELDDLDLDDDSKAASPPGPSADPGEEDQPPAGTGWPGRRG